MFGIALIYATSGPAVSVVRRQRRTRRPDGGPA
jgi:hypothetical protein